jgi:two-component system KDP operon response regulator KdpE
MNSSPNVSMGASLSASVLLVEDDPQLRHTLRQALSVEGYGVRSAASLADAQAQCAALGAMRQLPALVLLDLGLPDGPGQRLLASLKAVGASAVAVIVISAQHSEEEKIRLLDAGADDYLVKPFGIGELLARMRVVLRRRGQVQPAAITQYEVGGLCIDLAAHRVSLLGEPVRLTPTEFKLLACLTRQAGRVLTHRQLLLEVWGAEFTEHTHYLRLYMAQLRAKLEANPADPQRLLTEPGVGYWLAD